MHTRTLLATAALALLLAAAASPGQAQGAGGLTAVPSFALSVAYADFGDTPNPADDCAYLEMSSPGGKILPRDVRLLRSRDSAICSTTAPGSLITDADSAELFVDAPQLQTFTMTLKYQDTDSDGRLGANDTLYLDSTPGDGLQATSVGSGQVKPVLRLTRAADQPAGSLVLPGHQDYYSTGAGAKAIEGSVTWQDRDGDRILGSGDHVLLLPGRAAGFGGNATIPPDAVRLDAGAFGLRLSQVPGTSSSTTTTTAPSTTTSPTSTSRTTTRSTTFTIDTSSCLGCDTTTAGTPQLPSGQPRPTTGASKDSPPAALLAGVAALALGAALARRRLA